MEDLVVSRRPAVAEPIIALKGIVKAYATPAGTFLALKGVDLRIEKGEFLAVVGKSGSGKSTLLNMITGIDRPSSGEVIAVGAGLHRMSEAQAADWRGRSVGIVFQFFQLLPTLTIAENLMLAMDFCKKIPAGDRRRRALALLEKVGIARQANKLPSMLSGGEQQRAAVARAMANDPPLIVADEPTGNLDSETSQAVVGLLRSEAAEGKTVVVVTHDRDMAAGADRTISLADGLVVAESRP
jgi:putative ABC transport system ATP-binding protein